MLVSLVSSLDSRRGRGTLSVLDTDEGSRTSRASQERANSNCVQAKCPFKIYYCRTPPIEFLPPAAICNIRGAYHHSIHICFSRGLCRSPAGYSNRVSRYCACQLSTSKMPLHSSIIGSLRSQTPFSSYSNDSTIRSDTPCTGRSSAALLRRAASQTGRAAPASQKATLAEEEERPPPPELDRTTDLVARSKVSVDRTFLFEQSLPKDDAINRDHALFRLPSVVRRRIYSFCLGEETRKISLSPRFATKAVFGDDYFASPWNVLDPVLGALGAFCALRHELMTYFWNEYHFHVTLTPFTGPTFSPLSQVWLTKYLEIIQILTVEADFTRLGCSQLKRAPEFGYNMKNLENLLVNLVKGLSKRKGRSTMAEFNIICRRYAGFRPCEDSDGFEILEYEPVPYCPDDAFKFLDTILDFRGTLQKCRIAGFPLQYTELLLSTIFGEADAKPERIIPNDYPWPPLPPSPVCPSYGPSLIAASMSPMDVSLTLCRSRSFAQDFEYEMAKYEASIYSNYTTTPADETLVNEDADAAFGETAADDFRTNETLLLNIKSPEMVDGGTPVRCSPNDPATPRSYHPISDEFLQTPSDRLALTASLTFNTPNSPNAMNQMNEQDPAFLRTLNALRQHDDNQGGARSQSAMATTTSKVEESQKADRSHTSFTNHSSGGKKRYFSFLSKLRGLID